MLQTMLPLAVIQNGIMDGDAAMVFIVLAIVLVLAGFMLILARRYKRCPSNKILVVYGRTAKGQSAKPIHGGGTFVWPLIQNFDYLALDPMQIEIPLEGALSLENIRVSVPSAFTVAVGTEKEVMTNAAVRLLSLSRGEIIKQAEDIIFGQLRQVIASMRIEEINRDRDVFLSRVQSSLEPELAKIGLVLINVNIKDITDESGYLEAIGRKAASEAINQAEIDDWFDKYTEGLSDEQKQDLRRKVSTEEPARRHRCLRGREGARDPGRRAREDARHRHQDRRARARRPLGRTRQGTRHRRADVAVRTGVPGP